MEPYEYRENVHSRFYGSLLEGKLLSGIAGHNICLDYFGPPTQAETRLGLSQHGEAPMLKWRKKVSRTDRRQTSLTLSTHLPAARLTFTRNLRLQRGAPVVYFTETVVNENRKDHFFHWVQHVTLGPPFISARDSRVALPGTRGMTFPHPYNGKNSLLATNRGFRWPLAPALKGGTVDLTHTLLRPGTGIVVGVLLDPRSSDTPAPARCRKSSHPSAAIASSFDPGCVLKKCLLRWPAERWTSCPSRPSACQRFPAARRKHSMR